ncbi:MAG: TRAP transporter small permease subunit [Planctomycetes bacterium]|nr:TRAP transporter small permease subunit [Planctomycetota bacterium]
MYRLLSGLDAGVALLERGLLVGLVASLVLLSAAQVVARQLLPDWLPLFLRHEVLWIGLVGASLATREGSHITVDVVAKLLRGPAARRLEVVTGFAAYGGCLYLAQAAWAWQADKAARSHVLFRVEGLGLDVLEAWATVVIPAALSIMAFRFALRVWARVAFEGETGPAGGAATD